jgi:hypothetical protein
MRKLEIAGPLLVLFVVPIALFSQQSPCDLVPKALLQEPRMEYRGVYVNEAYFYSVLIPDSLVGYDQRTPPHHGFGIPLGEEPQSYIYVGGEANAYDYEEPVDAALAHLRHVRRDNKAIRSATISEARLGQLPAVRIIISYDCPGSATRYVRSSTFALSPRKGWLYEVTLYSPSGRYERDQRVLDQILQSWKYAGK